MTRLGSFITDHGILPAHFARRAHVSRGHLYKLRYGRAESRRPTMIRIARAASRILGRKVRVQELFDLGEEA